VKIMVVDDSPTFRAGVAKMLVQMGHEPMPVENGLQALERVREEFPDLVLMDANMPVMDGYEAARRIRGIRPDHWVPIIFLSGSEDDQDLQRGIEAGGDDYLVKPVSFVVLHAKIRAMRRIEDMRQKLVTLSVQLAAANRELEELSHRDGLTGIANRRHFDAYLDREFNRAARTHRPLGLVLLDVDHFKGYNDQHGHQAGDECLRQVAETLRSCCSRAADLAARYGGEEFALILPETDAAGAMKVAEHARVAIASLRLPHGASAVAPHVSISAGVGARAADAKLAVPQLLARADEALYLAKSRGRNCCILAP
jgi:diguanylate cyclase (GGDEF)-like protein